MYITKAEYNGLDLKHKVIDTYLDYTNGTLYNDTLTVKTPTQELTFDSEKTMLMEMVNQLCDWLTEVQENEK